LQPVRDRPERKLLAVARSALGPAEVAHQDQTPAATDKVFDRGQRCPNSPVIRDPAVAILRYVQIETHKDAPAVDGNVID
jgi:hypothetical protein